MFPTPFDHFHFHLTFALIPKLIWHCVLCRFKKFLLMTNVFRLFLIPIVFRQLGVLSLENLNQTLTPQSTFPDANQKKKTWTFHLCRKRWEQWKVLPSSFLLLVLDLILIHLILLQSKLGFNTYRVDHSGKCFILRCSKILCLTMSHNVLHYLTMFDIMFVIVGTFWYIHHICLLSLMHFEV